MEGQPMRETYIRDNGQPNDMTDFSTVQYWWQKDASGEGSEVVYWAIRRYLFCAFGLKRIDFEDDELRIAT